MTLSWSANMTCRYDRLLVCLFQSLMTKSFPGHPTIYSFPVCYSFRDKCCYVYNPLLDTYDYKPNPVLIFQYLNHKEDTRKILAKDAKCVHSSKGLQSETKWVCERCYVLLHLTKIVSKFTIPDVTTK